MEYRTLGSSDLKVSAITFGAWAIGGWMWGGTDVKAAREAILAAYDNGVTTIDTAPAYGQGLSEQIVGNVLDVVPRDRVQILTKYGLRWDTKEGVYYFSTKDANGKELRLHKFAGRKGVLYECEQSLLRLKTDYIDLYQIHWHDPSTPIEETMEAVARLIEQGKVRYAGVCNYNVELLKQAKTVIPIISNQVEYNMLERGIEKELVPYCLKENVGILAYSSMARGLLTGKFSPDHKFAEGDHRAEHKLFKPHIIRRVNEFLNTLKPIAESHNATIGQIVLRWTIDQPGITSALAGARTKEQVIQNAHAVDVRLSKDEENLIQKNLEALTNDIKG